MFLTLVSSDERYVGIIHCSDIQLSKVEVNKCEVYINGVLQCVLYGKYNSEKKEITLDAE